MHPHSLFNSYKIDIGEQFPHSTEFWKNSVASPPNEKIKIFHNGDDDFRLVAFIVIIFCSLIFIIHEWMEKFVPN